MIPIDEAWDTDLYFLIRYRNGPLEYFKIPRENRKEFKEQFKVAKGQPTDSIVPPLSVLRRLCEKYGVSLSKSQFDELLVFGPIGLSTNGHEGYRIYVEDKREISE